MAEEEENFPLLYLEGKPESFKNSTDIILVLDSGDELPVHSAIISAHSEPLCEILTLKQGKKAKVADGKSINRVPFPDCSQSAAVSFLQYLYTLNPAEVLTIKSAQSVVHLAHKFDLEPALRQCDLFLHKFTNERGESPKLWVNLPHPFTIRWYARPDGSSRLQHAFYIPSGIAGMTILWFFLLWLGKYLKAKKLRLNHLYTWL